MDKNKHIATGGYANIYYGNTSNEVIKEELKYILVEDAPPHINYSTVVDLAFHQSFLMSATHPFPPSISFIDDYAIHQDMILLKMPHYGTPLQSFLRGKTYKTRQALCPVILLQIVDTCLHLEANGVQHTDIKPNNILVDDAINTTLIDFNIICHQRVLKKNELGWEEGLGTWNYCAPEITEYLRPSDTSMVWSIGLLIAYICYRCPFYAYPMSDARRYKHKTWRTMIQQCRAKNPRHLPLTDAHMAFIPTGLYELYEEATAWDPKHRISLKELREKLRSIHFPNISSFTPWISRFYADPTKMPSELRKPGIQILYSCCKRMNMMTLFCNAVSIFDRCHAIIYPSNSPQIMGAILYLLGLMKGYYVIDNPKWTEPVCELLKLKSFHELEPLVWEIGEWVRWEVLEKGADVYLAEKKRSFIYSRLRRKLLSIQKPYCMQSLAEEMI